MGVMQAMAHQLAIGKCEAKLRSEPRLFCPYHVGTGYRCNFGCLWSGSALTRLCGPKLNGVFMKAIFAAITGNISAVLRARLIPIAGGILLFAVAALWLRGNHYRNARDQWRNTANGQVEAVRNASAAAAVQAEAARLETERRSAAHARKADHEETPAIDDLRNAADRFAAANRLRPQTNRSVPGSATAPATNSPATNSDRPGDNPLEGRTDGEAVLVPRQRYDEFVDNTLRLKRVRNWGEGLITDGLAVKEGAE